MAAQMPPRKKFVTHKTLQEGWTYISTSDGTIIGVRISVTKVMKLLNPADGSELKDPAGNPLYEFQSTNVARVLTKEEYDVIRKEGEGGLV